MPPTLDPRLIDPQNVADALDAIGDYMEMSAARGHTQQQYDAISKFRAAWPTKPAETEPTPSDETSPETEQTTPT